jgi:MFS family permease
MKPSPGLRASPMYKWALIAMLWCVCFLNYADRQAIFSVFPLIKTQMHLSNFELGIVGSSFMWMYALFGPFAGWLCDRLSRRWLVVGALIFWSLVTAATALAQTYPQLVLCRALGGLGEAFYFPAAMSLIGDYHSPATRSRAMSLHQSSVYAGSIAGGALSGLLGQNYGWRSSFVVFGSAGIVLGLIVLGLLREPQRGMSDPGFDALPPAQSSLHSHGGGSFADGLRAVFTNRMALLLAGVFIAANFVAVVFLTWMPTFLYQKFHMSLAMAGLSGTAYLQLASVFGVLAGGLLADSLRRSSRGGRLATQALGLLCGVPFLFLTGWTTLPSLLIVGLAGFGFFKGIYDANIFAGLYDVVPVHQRGSAAGVLNSLGWLGGGFAPLLIALAAAHVGLSYCLSATALIYLAAGMSLFLGARRINRLGGSQPHANVQ